MSSPALVRVKAHLPIIIDYLGLAAGIALIVYSSKTLSNDRASPTFSVVYASLVLGSFLIPVSRRTPILYGVLLLIGIVATVFYALGIFLVLILLRFVLFRELMVDIVHGECGYQVIIGRPRDLHTPTIPKDPKHPMPAEPWLNCRDVAGSWWLNLILTFEVTVDYMWILCLLFLCFRGILMAVFVWRMILRKAVSLPKHLRSEHLSEWSMTFV